MSDGGVVTIPLDGPVALEEFEQLPPKAKYTLLQRAKEAWWKMRADSGSWTDEDDLENRWSFMVIEDTPDGSPI